MTNCKTKNRNAGVPKRRIRNTAVVLAGAMALGGCASTIHKTSKLGEYNVLAVDAKQRIIISGKRPDGAHVICAEPSPDAIVASASYAAATLTAKDDVAAQTGLGRNESVGSIGIRTETIQLLRDGYFRICEAYLNGGISKAEYDLVILGIDTFMITLVAISAVGGAVAAPGVILNPAGSLTINSDGVNLGAGNPADKSAFGAAMATAATLTKEQVNGIVTIVNSYLHSRPKSRDGLHYLSSRP